MESAEQQLDRCLETLRRVGPDGPVEDLLWADMPALLANEAIGQLLIAHIARLDDEAIDEADAEKALLECLLDVARRAREDDRPSGQQFLAAAEATLDALDPGATAASGTIALGSIYHRAGLAVPTAVQSLQAAHFATEEGAGVDDPAAIAANLADSIMDMREQCGGDPFGVYLMLGDSLAALPDEGCEVLIPELARWDGVFWQRLVLYWLLDPRFALRRAAAGAMRQLAETGRIEEEVTSRLSWLRHLLPQDEVLQEVDAALAAYRKRHRAWPQPQDSGALDQARASIPDGVGAQYLALGRYGESGYNWSMVLIKSGYGVRDAYVLADLDPAADAELWTTLADAVDLRPVSRATVSAFLGAAVAENLDKGEAPAPGLIDVVAGSGLTDLRPRSLSGQDWLDEFDPDQRLTNLTAQKRGRLINRSARWHEELDVLAAWFENNSEATAILEREEPGKGQERALREYLETRRAWWGELCLRSALVVQRDDTDELADSFAATGLALLEGREFKRIPLLTSILETTIAAHEEGNLLDEPALADDFPGLPLDDMDAGEEPTEPGVLIDPAQPRLQPLFENEPVAGQWPGGYFGLHGYLFAITTHPQVLPPSEWIGPVFEALQSGGTGLNEQADAQTVLTDVLNLYNQINQQVMDLKPALPQGCAMRSEPADNVGPHAPLGQWSLGFRHAREHFGHLVGSEFDASDEMQEGIGLAVEMLEFFGNPDDTTNTDTAQKDRLEQLAAMACEYLYENLHILCAVRASLRSELEEGPDAEPADPASGAERADTEPLTPEAILARLDQPGASYQWAAMDQAVEQSAAMTPLLLERLETVIADPQPWLDADTAGLLYTVALLGYFEEPAAHDPLLRLAALPEETLESLLGDATTEFLPVVLWQTSSGETAGLKSLLENRGASGFGRGAAANALGFGVLFGTLDRGEISSWLASLLRDKSLAEFDDPVWFSIAHVLLDLYPDEHETSLRTYIREENSDPFAIRESDLDRVLARDRDSALTEQRERAASRFPDSVHGYLSHWYGFQPRDPDREPRRADPFGDPFPDDYGYGGYPPIPGSGGATKPKRPDPEKKKKKRKQQKKARKTNRKRK